MKIKLFFRLIGHFFGFGFVALSLLMNISSAKKKAKYYVNDPEEYKIEARYKLVYKMIKKFLYMNNIEIEYSGLENVPKKPVLFVPNHKSNVDSLCLIKILMENKGYPWFVFVAKKEIENMKKVSPAAKLIDTLFIERDNIRQIYNIIQEEKKIIKEKSLIVFGEGTRIISDEIGEMNPNVLEPAYNSMCPIVPIVVFNTKNILNNKKKKQFFKYKKVTIKFLEQIKQNEYANHDKKYTIEKIRNKIQTEYNNFNKDIEQNEQ